MKITKRAFNELPKDVFMRSMVRGYTWKVKMNNGAVFDVWTPYKRTRREMIPLLLAQANGDYDDVYARGDIESVWETIGS
jgi:hypothetical protein